MENLIHIFYEMFILAQNVFVGKRYNGKPYSTPAD